MVNIKNKCDDCISRNVCSLKPTYCSYCDSIKDRQEIVHAFAIIDIRCKEYHPELACVPRIKTDV